MVYIALVKMVRILAYHFPNLSAHQLTCEVSCCDFFWSWRASLTCVKYSKWEVGIGRNHSWLGDGCCVFLHETISFGWSSCYRDSHFTQDLQLSLAHQWRLRVYKARDNRVLSEHALCFRHSKISYACLPEAKVLLEKLLLFCVTVLVIVRNT